MGGHLSFYVFTKSVSVRFFPNLKALINSDSKYWTKGNCLVQYVVVKNVKKRIIFSCTVGPVEKKKAWIEILVISDINGGLAN